jgi:hypothetical protein
MIANAANLVMVQTAHLACTEAAKSTYNENKRSFLFTTVSCPAKAQYA